MTQPVETNGVAPETPAEGAPPAETPVIEPKVKLAEVARRERHRLAQRNADREAAQKAQARAEAAEARAQAAQQQTQAVMAKLQEIEGLDPLDYLEKRGVQARTLAERIVKKGTPEEAVAQAVAKAQAAEELAQRAIREAGEREQRATQLQAQQAARNALQATFDSVKAETPILAKLCQTPGQLEALYMEAWNRLQAHPVARLQTYTDAEVLKAVEQAKRAELEDQLDALELEALEKVLTKRKNGASLKPAQQVAGGPHEGETAKAGKTLAGGLTSAPSSSWKPANWKKLSEKEQNAILIQRYRQGLLK